MAYPLTAAHFHLSKIYFEQGKFDETLRRLDKALKSASVASPRLAAALPSRLPPRAPRFLRSSALAPQDRAPGRPFLS